MYETEACVLQIVLFTVNIAGALHENVMKQCTVAGTREHPGLPFDVLRKLKQEVSNNFHGIEKYPLSLKTKLLFDAPGQACKRLRSQ